MTKAESNEFIKHKSDWYIMKLPGNHVHPNHLNEVKAKKLTIQCLMGVCSFYVFLGSSRMLNKHNRVFSANMKHPSALKWKHQLTIQCFMRKCW